MSSTPLHDPSNPLFESILRESFGRQAFMKLLGASLDRVQPGRVEISMPFDDRLTQQHGFIHAGAIASILDSACGYAALSLMPHGSSVLSVEYKVNLLRPAIGERFLAKSRVVKPGRTLSFCEGELVAHAQGAEKLVATITATMMQVTDRPGVQAG